MEYFPDVSLHFKLLHFANMYLVHSKFCIVGEQGVCTCASLSVAINGTFSRHYILLHIASFCKYLVHCKSTLFVCLEGKQGVVPPGYVPPCIW